MFRSVSPPRTIAMLLVTIAAAASVLPVQPSVRSSRRCRLAIEAVGGVEHVLGGRGRRLRRENQWGPVPGGRAAGLPRMPLEPRRGDGIDGTVTPGRGMNATICRSDRTRTSRTSARTDHGTVAPLPTSTPAGPTSQQRGGPRPGPGEVDHAQQQSDRGQGYDDRSEPPGHGTGQPTDHVGREIARNDHQEK